MSIIELDEIELHSAHVEEGVGAILHSILYLRCPTKHADRYCTALAPLVHVVSEDESAVQEAIEKVFRVSTYIGPYLYRSRIIIEVFLQREKKSMFGFGFIKIEKVVLEVWKLPLIVNEMAALDEDPDPTSTYLGSSRFLEIMAKNGKGCSCEENFPPSASQYERARITNTEREEVSNRLLSALQQSALAGDLSQGLGTLEYDVRVEAYGGSSRWDTPQHQPKQSGLCSETMENVVVGPDKKLSWTVMGAFSRPGSNSHGSSTHKDGGSN